MRKYYTIGIALLMIAGCDRAQVAEQPLDLEPAQEIAQLVIENTGLFDSRSGEVETGVTVVIEGDRFVSVSTESVARSPSAQVIDGAGKWIIPGLVDIHVHESDPGYLKDMLGWGVTTVFNMPKKPPQDPMAAEETSQLAGSPTPRLILSEMFSGEFPDNQLPGVYLFIKPQTVEEAIQSVNDSYAKGYRRIKIIRDDTVFWSGESYRAPLMPQSVYEALVSTARTLGMQVYVHAAQRSTARDALPHGADAFIHGIMDEAINADDLAMIVAADSVWAPTMNAIFSFGDQSRYGRWIVADDRLMSLLDKDEQVYWQETASSEALVFFPPMAHLIENTPQYVDVSEMNARSMLAAGIELAVGTDGGPGGISTQLELEFLTLIGLTAGEVLRAATLGGATALGWQSEIGSIEEGKLADLVILNADPLADIRNTRDIAWVIKGGIPYLPAELALEATP